MLNKNNNNNNIVLYIISYSWFYTYNLLSEKIPKQDSQMKELGRRAIISFFCICYIRYNSNSICRFKVYKQSYPIQISYPQVVRNVIQEDGIRGLMFRTMFKTRQVTEHFLPEAGAYELWMYIQIMFQ